MRNYKLIPLLKLIQQATLIVYFLLEVWSSCRGEMDCTYDDPTQFLSQQMYYGDLSANAAKRMNKFRYPQPAPSVRVELGRSFRENRKMSMLAKIDYLIDELQLGKQCYSVSFS